MSLRSVRTTRPTSSSALLLGKQGAVPVFPKSAGGRQASLRPCTKFIDPTLSRLHRSCVLRALDHPRFVADSCLSPPRFDPAARAESCDRALRQKKPLAPIPPTKARSAGFAAPTRPVRHPCPRSSPRYSQNGPEAADPRSERYALSRSTQFTADRAISSQVALSCSKPLTSRFSQSRAPDRRGSTPHVAAVLHRAAPRPRAEEAP